MAVRRSSSSMTRGSPPTFQAPAAASRDPAPRICGISTRANHATSASLAATSVRQAPRRRARRTNGIPAAPAAMRTARNHQAQLGTVEDSGVLCSTPGAASAVALEVSLAEALGASDPGSALREDDGDATDVGAREGLADPDGVGAADAVGVADAVAVADVVGFVDAVGVGDCRSPSERVGVGSAGVRVGVAVREAVMLGEGR